MRTTIQLSKATYKPDFVLSIENDERKCFVILDAKFKSYSAFSLESDLSILTFKYLHKLGLTDASECKIIGLFPISLSSTNRRKSIYKNEFDLRGVNCRIPQIGSIEIDPYSFDTKNNSFTEIIEFCIRYISNNSV